MWGHQTQTETASSRNCSHRAQFYRIRVCQRKNAFAFIETPNVRTFSGNTYYNDTCRASNHTQKKTHTRANDRKASATAADEIETHETSIWRHVARHAESTYCSVVEQLS